MKEWHYTEKEFPQEDMSCLVVLKGSSHIRANCWNNHYQVWDTADGDDYEFNKNDVYMWMAFPDLPKDFTIQKKDQTDV